MEALRRMNGGSWIEVNWPILKRWSRRWSPEHWDELLSQYAIYVHQNWHKFSKIPDGEQRIKFSQTWMKNNVKWQNSEFNKLLRTNNFAEEWEIADQPENLHLEAYCESDRSDITEYIVDITTNFSEWDASRLFRLRQIYLELPIHHKVLYDLYFTEMLSMRDIGKKLDLPLSSVYTMITELKTNIRQKCGMTQSRF